LIDNINLLASHYSGYSADPLSYGTVRDYCDSFDHLNPLATAVGDLKDCQRPWVLKAMISQLHRPSRLIEVGAGEPVIADLLQKLGHEVWIVDPYDGSGHGPTAFEQYTERYPNLHFARTVFSDELSGFEENSFDCVYSISVLEHIPIPALAGVFRGLQRFLKEDGLSLHAIDHVLRGNGSEYHRTHLETLMEGFGFSSADLDQLIDRLRQDIDTYYLSAESHNRWRGGLAYDQFPMRVCVSIQVIAQAKHIGVPSTEA
jgi:ubiquinone/menaquinone biosynthesis C-methylase UbiE